MDVIKEWMAVAAAIVGAVVWLVRLEGWVNKSEDGITKVESRLTRFENTHHEQAFQRGEGIDYGPVSRRQRNGLRGPAIHHTHYAYQSRDMGRYEPDAQTVLADVQGRSCLTANRGVVRYVNERRFHYIVSRCDLRTLTRPVERLRDSDVHLDIVFDRHPLAKAFRVFFRQIPFDVGR